MTSRDSERGERHMTSGREKSSQSIANDKYPFSPETYPGSRPRYSFFFTTAGIFPCSLQTLGRLLTDRKLTPIESRFAILAYGSNACPGRLLEKQMTEVPVIYGRITGAQAVYAKRTTTRKYVPATLARKTGSRATWITLLTAEQLQTMDASEGRSDAYVLAEVRNVEFSTEGRTVAPLYAYVDVSGGVMTCSGKTVSLHTTNQMRARSLLASASREVAATWLKYEIIPGQNSPDSYSQFH